MNRTVQKSVRQGPPVLDEIRDRVDLAVVAPRLGVHRENKGWACPFHDDHEHSLLIEKQRFLCLPCGARGDCFDLAQRLLACSFLEAVEVVCRAAGIAASGALADRRLPAEAAAESAGASPAPARGHPPSPARVVEVLTDFARLSRAVDSGLSSGLELPFRRRLGISTRTLLARKVRCVHDPRDAKYALTRRFPLADLQEARLFDERGDFQFYRHRLIFPTFWRGRVVGLQALNGRWKGTADGARELSAGSHHVPFNYKPLARPGRPVFVAQGVLGCLSLLELGRSDVGVPAATAFKAEWAPLFDGVATVVLAFDDDAGGREAAAAARDVFAEAGRRRVEQVEWPAGVKDANEYLTKHVRHRLY